VKYLGPECDFLVTPRHDLEETRMSDPFPPSTPNEPQPGGATPAGTPPPGAYPPVTGGTGGGSSAGGPTPYPPAAGQGDYATSGAPTEPVYTNPADIPGPAPQAAPSAPAAGTGRPASSMTGDQVKTAFQNANRLDLGIMAAGLLAFIFSLFPYYSYSSNLSNVTGAGALGIFDTSFHRSAWHGFFGWFGVLLALAGAVLVLLPLLGVRLGLPTRTAALGLFAAATLSTLLALLIIPGKADCQGVKACDQAVSYGHGFGFWLTLLAIIAGLVLCVMRKDAVD
jgi:hypothetical protein